jgi:hypothetical protein
MIRCALLAVIILTFGFGEAPAVCGDEYPPAPPGFWRDDPHDPVLRDVPSLVGLSQQEEADCSVYGGSFLPKYAQSK